MKKNYSVNTTNSRNHFVTPSRLSSLLPLLLVAFCLFGVNENAWGATLYGKTAVKDGKGGKAKVEIYSRYRPNHVQDSEETTGSSYVSVSLSVYAARWGFCKFYATVDDGYSFAGWYNTSNSWVSSDSPYQTGDTGSGRTDQFYAKFDPVTVSSAGSSTISFNCPATKTTTLTFKVSKNADAAADFNAPTVTANSGWSITDWSFDNTNKKVTVTLSFTADSDTLKGNHSATVTLKAKSNEYNTGTVTASVDLTPTLTYDNGTCDISVSDNDKTTLDVTTLLTAYKGADDEAGDGTITYSLKTANSNVSLTSAGIFYAKATGTYTIVASATKGRYYAKTAEFNVTVGKRTPTIEWNVPEHIYASELVEKAATVKYNDATVTEVGVKLTSNNTSVLSVEDSLNLRAAQNLASETTVKITAKTDETSFYKSITDEYTYTVEPKATPEFWLNSTIDLPEDPVQSLTLKIGETATMSFVNTDESNNRFNYPNKSNVSTQYVSYTHNSTNNTGVITGTAYGDEVIQFSQTGTTTIFEHTRSIHVYVRKHPVTITTTQDNKTWKVDEEFDPSDLFTNETTPVEDHPFSTISISSSEPTVINYDAESGKWKAVGAGTATLTISHPSTNSYWDEASITASITVEKYDPVFDWTGLRDTLNFNTLYVNPVTSSFTGNPVTYTSNNSAVQVVHDTILQTAATASNAVIITASQVGNYKYNDYSDTKTVKVLKLRNHVEVNVTSPETYNAVYGGRQGAVDWAGNNGIRLGGSDNGAFSDPAWNWGDKYVDIKFEGVPKTISFTTGNTSIAPTAKVTWPGSGNDNGFWYMIEYPEGESEKTIWTDNDNGNPGDISRDLKPNTNKVRICYTGNFAGYVKNLKITERTELTASKDTVKFGENHRVGDNATEGSFTIDWYNLNPIIVTSDNDKFEVVTDEVTSKKDSFATNVTISLKYHHDAEGLDDKGTITVKDAANEKTVTVVVVGKTYKREQAINWLPEYEGESPVLIGGDTMKLATATSGLKVTYVSSNTDIAEVINDTLVYAKSVGSVTIRAKQEGNGSWSAAVDSVKEFRVTQKIRQIIAWEQNLTRLNPEAEVKRDTLRARVMVQNQETGELEEVPAQTEKITYAITGASGIVTLINDSIITYTTTEGSTAIRASVPEDETYAAASLTKPVRVRKPARGCDDPLLPTNLQTPYEIFTGTLDETHVDITIDRSQGEPEAMIFYHRGEYWWLLNRWSFYEGELQVQQYVNNAWSNVLYSMTPAIGESNESARIPLDRRATKIRITRPKNGQGYHYIDSIAVFRKKYIESATTAINLDSINRGDIQNIDVTVNYSNCKSDLVLTHKDAQLSLKQGSSVINSVSIECGEVNHFTMRVSIIPETPGEFKDTIVIADTIGGSQLVIPVSAVIKKSSQNIVWNQDPTALTTDDLVLTATATSNIAVTYSVVGESDVAEVNETTGEVTIYKGGEVTFRATQSGNGYYDAVYADKTFTISKVKSVITTDPTAQAMILPNTSLNDCLLSGGEASVAGSFAWDDNTISATLNNNGYKVNFIPENANWYDTASCIVIVPVSKASQTITWNFAEEEMYCNATFTFDATASSGLTVTYATSDKNIAYINEQNELKIITGGTVTITAKQEGNEIYAAAVPQTRTFVIKRFTPEIITLPTAEPMNIGKLLSDASLTGGLVQLNGVEVEGSFAWVDGNSTQMNTAGSFTRNIVFNPANSNYYEPIYSTMTVVVEKYAPVIINVYAGGSQITYGDKLSSSTLGGYVVAEDQVKSPHVLVPGSIVWADPDEKPEAGSPTYADAVFVPENQDWYTVAEFLAPLPVIAASAASYSATTTLVHGQTLAEAVLTNTTTGLYGETVNGTVAWASSVDQTFVPVYGQTYTFAIDFSSDNDNYTNGSGLCTVTVEEGVIFDGSGTGTLTAWENQDNWKGDSKPSATDRVTIAADVDINEDDTIGGITINAGKTVTVKSGATLTIGAYNSFNRETYGNIHVEEGGKLILTSGRVGVNNLYLDASLGNRSLNISANSGQIRNPELIDVNGDAYFDLVLDPVKCSYGWYDFTVPFPVDNRTGISRFQNGAWNTSLRTEQQYAIMTYHEEIRANGDYGWKKYYGIMQPGKCYTITVDNTAPLYRFRKIAGESITTPSSVALTATDGKGGDVHKGWNSIGNGTLTHTHVSSQYVTKVQVYDHATNSYSVLDNFGTVDLPVGTALFVQTSQASNMLFTDVNTIVAEAPMRTQGRTLDEYLLAFGLENDAVNVDRLYLSASEDAENVYEIGHDLSKFEVSTKVAQIWADAYGQKLCDVEAPLVADQAIIPISLYAAQTGTYTLDVVRGPQDASLYLMYNGAVVWNLSQSAYTFDLTRGTNSAYSLLLTAEAPAISTGSDAISGEKTQQVEKILLNGQLYILRDGQMYDATGKKVK